MMTSFSFDPILRGLVLPKTIPAPTRVSIGRAESSDGTVYVASLFDARGVVLVSSWNRSSESAFRLAALGFLAGVARLTNADVSEAQARVVRMTLN